MPNKTRLNAAGLYPLDRRRGAEPCGSKAEMPTTRALDDGRGTESDGFSPRKVVKAKPYKKLKETDAIFDNSKRRPGR
jgi:hypothetical protein